MNRYDSQWQKLIAVARQVRRIHAAVLAELGEQPAEHVPGQRARVDADEWHALVEAAVRGEGGVHVQLPVAAVHVHPAEMNCHGRGHPRGKTGMSSSAAVRKSLHDPGTSGWECGVCGHSPRAAPRSH